MMRLKVDRNLFEQIGLDSGSLTILGTVLHSFREPGEYRGAVYGAEGRQAVFYLTVDPNCPAAHINIDLASLVGNAGVAKEDCGCEQGERRFTVNPRGYVAFHVSGGGGGHSIQVRRAKEDPKEKIWNSQKLDEGDLYSAVIIRPGTYSAVNLETKAECQIVVSYPQIGKTAYRPPAPMRVMLGPKGFEVKQIELKPAQGLVFDVKSPARIAIRLLKPDDGPGGERRPQRPGWTKKVVPGIAVPKRSLAQRKTTGPLKPK
jgi:hypothetical protein